MIVMETCISRLRFKESCLNILLLIYWSLNWLFPVNFKDVYDLGKNH